MTENASELPATARVDWRATAINLVLIAGVVTLGLGLTRVFPHLAGERVLTVGTAIFGALGFFQCRAIAPRTMALFAGLCAMVVAVVYAMFALMPWPAGGFGIFKALPGVSLLLVVQFFALVTASQIADPSPKRRKPVIQ